MRGQQPSSEKIAGQAQSCKGFLLTSPSPCRGESRGGGNVGKPSPEAPTPTLPPAGGGRSKVAVRGGEFLQCSQNYTQNAILILKHFIIPESQYTVSFFFKECRSVRVVFLLLGMRSAIQLNH